MSEHWGLDSRTWEAPTLEGRALADLGQQLAAMRAERDCLADQVEAMTKVLRELEWDPYGGQCCPSCYGFEDEDGHAVDCALSTALAGVTR